MKSRVIQGEPSRPKGDAGSERAQVSVVDIRDGRPAVPGADRGSATDPAPPVSGPASRVLAVLLQVPFTLSVAVLTLLAGVATAALWRPLAERPLTADVAYGLPAVREGRWWTLVTGPFFAQSPLQYLPTLGTFVLLCGFAELRLGTARAAGAACITQLVGVLGAAAVLAVSSGHDWLWADQVATARDLGFSAGALGAAAAASAVLPAPWRWRARAALTTYALISFVYVGVLWDLEHLLAVAAGLALGPPLAGRRPRFAFPRLSRREYRLLAAGAFAVSALAALIAPWAETGGPFATGMPGTEAALTSGPPFALLWLLVAAGLRRGRRGAWIVATTASALSAGALIVIGVVLTVRGEPGRPVVTYMLLFTVAQLVILVTGRRAFANPSKRRARRTAGSLLALPTEAEQAAARHVLSTQGGVNRLSWMTTWPENRWYLPDGLGSSGYVAYRLHAGVAIGLCDPVAASGAERARLMRGFADRAEAAGLVPTLFSVTVETTRTARGLGWQVLRVAEEAVVELESLSFRGKAWQDVRTALNRAEAAGITHRLVTLADQPRGVQVQVRALAEQWTSDKGLPEMGFTLGGVDEALDRHVRVGLAVDRDGTVHGITSWMPVFSPGGGPPAGWTLDVMRKAPDGFRSAMEFLIASACLTFRDEHAAFASLSGVPLAQGAPGDTAADRGVLDDFLNRLGAALEPYYGFRSLQAFKAKFQPRSEPLYLVFPDAGALPRIGLALSRAYLPEAGPRDLLVLARQPRSRRPRDRR